MLERFHHRFAAAPGKAMEEDRRSPKTDAERWYAVFVSRTAAHAASASPYAVQPFDNVLRTALKLIWFSYLGHRPTPVQSPTAAQPPLCAPGPSLPAMFVRYMF